MKKTFCKIVSVLMLITMLFSTGIAGITSSAASESDYVATFSTKTDKTSLSKGDTVTVNVNLKTNYYIYAMQIAVIYDGDALEVQNTSPTSNKSYLTFKGKMASNYHTDGNWRSPAKYYEKQNSNPSYWKQKSVMDRYKIAYASWAADSSRGDGNLVKLSSEETIVSFVLKAKKDIKDVSSLIFMSDDFIKTKEFPGGLWFCGRSSEKVIQNIVYEKHVVATGQTIKYSGSAAPAIPDPGTGEGGGGNVDGGYEDDSAVAINYQGTACLEDRLSATVLRDYRLKWSSDDESIVTVDEDGNIYGVSIGTTTVTATSTKGDYEKTFNVTVSYSIFQWIIIIVLFGWIWYI